MKTSYFSSEFLCFFYKISHFYKMANFFIKKNTEKAKKRQIKRFQPGFFCAKIDKNEE